MPVNLKSANREDLLRTYYYETDAPQATDCIDELLRLGNTKHLSRLLRHHSEEPITSPSEIRLRASVDRFLTCCSMLEIATLTNFIEDPRDTSFGDVFYRILNDSCVRKYYEVHYPLRMPQLFRSRLAGENLLILTQRDDGLYAQLMLEFVQLDKVSWARLEDGPLLRMLDSFTISGVRFDDVVAVIASPENFISRLEEDDVISTALKELSYFVQFCGDLRLLLLRAGEEPLLQSAMWHHYGYWFNIIGAKLRDRLELALSQFRNWKPPPEDPERTQEVQNYVIHASEAIEELTSEKFATALDRVFYQH